jgi:Icc-related predicted phosphoesterase
MRALVIADRNPHIDIAEVAEREKVDLLITLGDLDRADLLTAAQLTSIPKIGIYGNHDSGNYMNEIGIMDMHLKIRSFGGLTFGGFQGCVRYKQNPDAIMYTQEEADQMMMNFPKVDVFISHCPPRGINDEEEVAHQGFDALRTYVDLYSPKVLLHGHTYPTEEEMVRTHGSTRIEYVYKSRIVEL